MDLEEVNILIFGEVDRLKSDTQSDGCWKKGCFYRKILLPLKHGQNESDSTLWI